MPVDAMVVEAVTVQRRGATGGRRTVLKSVAATFRPGEIAVIDGPTGVGKTTLLHLLGGLARPDSGQIRWGDRVVSRYVGHHRQRWRRQLGMAFQLPHLLADLTVLENVMLPLVPHSATSSGLRAAAGRALDHVSLSGVAGRSAGELSAGEQQRVGLARALAGEPTLVLADEPTAHQDGDGVALVMAALERVKLRGGLVVVASHDPRVIGGPGPDRRFVLRHGVLSVRKR